jgi:hypothetical protein
MLGASKSEQQDLHTRTMSGDRGHKELVRLGAEVRQERRKGTAMYGLDRREPIGVRDARDYRTIVATLTGTDRPQQLLHNSVCMNARPIRSHTVTDI